MLLGVKPLFTYGLEHSFDLAEQLQHYCSGRCGLCWKQVSYVTSILIKDRDYASKLKTVVQSELISGCPEKKKRSVLADNVLDRNKD